MELSQIEGDKEETNPLKSDSKMPDTQGSFFQRNKVLVAILGAVLVVAVVAIAVGISLSNSGSDEKEGGIWTGKCYECQAGECQPNEVGSSTQCPNGTVACIRGTAENYSKKECGPKNALSGGLVLNGCIENFGEKICTCNTDNCNKD